MLNGILKSEEGKFSAWFFNVIAWRLEKIRKDDFSQKNVACHQQKMYVSDDEGIFRSLDDWKFTQGIDRFWSQYSEKI